MKSKTWMSMKQSTIQELRIWRERGGNEHKVKNDCIESAAFTWSRECIKKTGELSFSYINWDYVLPYIILVYLFIFPTHVIYKSINTVIVNEEGSIHCKYLKTCHPCGCQPFEFPSLVGVTKMLHCFLLSKEKQIETSSQVLQFQEKYILKNNLIIPRKEIT